MNLGEKVTFDLIQMTKVAKSWQSAVVDFTKRNNLLFFKSKSVTLDLGKAQASELNQLIAGSSASLKNLVTEDELEEHYRKRSLLQRSVYPEDIAEGVYFFASDLSSKSTGNFLNVDAGNAASFTR
jgi:enoyl-[acyl-carrier-protein] reductase (NADH)